MEQGSEHIDYIELISNYLAQETTAEENAILEAWIAANPENKKTFESFKSAWDFSDIPTEIASIDVDMEWDSFQSKISSTTEDMPPPKVVTMDSSAKEADKESFNFMRIAAAIVLLIGIVGVFLLTSPNKEQIIASNDIVHQELPDGSKISLNRTTILEYEESFNEKVRKVKLKGEAHFEVAHNPKKPFMVESGDILVTVLGTNFVVKAYDNEDHVQVIVKSGRVSVRNTHTGKEVILSAGDEADFSKETAILEKTETQEENFLSWKTKKFNFRDKTLKRVVKKLNNAFGTKIIIKNKAMEKCRLTVKFENQSIDEILDVIEATLDLKISKKQDQIILEGAACN